MFNQYIPEILIRNIEILYKFDIFRTNINLILSLIKNKQVKLETQEKRFSESQEGAFKTKRGEMPIILIKTNSPDIIIHEFAHCMEQAIPHQYAYELVDSIKKILQNLNQVQIVIRKKIYSLMIKELEAYKKEDVFHELFARFFEILAFSREIMPNKSQIPLQETMKIFQQSLNKTTEIYCYINQNKIDSSVQKFSKTIPLRNNVDISWKDKLNTQQINKWSNKNQSIFRTQK